MTYPALSLRVIRAHSARYACYTYDAMGTLTGDDTYAYTYSARGRLAKVTYGTRSNTYILNGLGQRTRKRPATASALA